MRELAVTSGESTKMLDTVEEALDHIAGAVRHRAVAAFGFTVRARRNHDMGAGGASRLHKGTGIEAFVRNDGSGTQMLDKLLRKRNALETVLRSRSVATVCLPHPPPVQSGTHATSATS